MPCGGFCLLGATGRSAVSIWTLFDGEILLRLIPTYNPGPVLFWIRKTPSQMVSVFVLNCFKHRKEKMLDIALVLYVLSRT